MIWSPRLNQEAALFRKLLLENIERRRQMTREDVAARGDTWEAHQKVLASDREVKVRCIEPPFLNDSCPACHLLDGVESQMHGVRTGADPRLDRFACHRCGHEVDV